MVTTNSSVIAIAGCGWRRAVLPQQAVAMTVECGAAESPPAPPVKTARANGFHDIEGLELLNKPFRRAELAERLRRLLDA